MTADPGLGITRQLDQPFFEAGAALSSSFSPSVIGIAGQPFLIDTESGQYKREGFEVVQQRNVNDQRDVLLLPQDVWRQQAQSWHYGAGQSNFDRDETLIYRFNDSYGVDVWTEWRCQLLHETSQIPWTSGFTGSTWLTLYQDYLAVVNGDRVYWTQSPSASVSAASTVFSNNYTVVDIANTAHAVTALTNDWYIWYVDGPSGTSTKWANHQYTANATFIAWEKDYLLIGDGNVLRNAIKSNNPTTIYTHPDQDFRWYGAASGPQQIYVIGRLGDRTTIHRVGIKSDGTGLIPCIVAAVLPDGEIGYSIDSYLNFILIGTNKGVRVAVPDGNGDLTLGSIIPTTEPVHCFEGQDRFIWYGNSSIDGRYSVSNDTTIFPSGTVCGLGRMDLSRTTINALTPAYANDIVAATQTGKQVNSIVTFQDRRTFSINGGGVWYETANHMPGGWLKQGVISYSVEDLKTGLYTQTKWEPLNGSISLDLSYDSAGFVRVATFPIEGSIRSGNVSMNGTQFSRIEPRFVLRRSETDAQLTPLMTRWEIRAVPVKGRNSRWTLPILNREEVEIDGVKYVRDPLLVLDALLELVQGGNIFTLQESNRAYQVHGKDFLWIPDSLTTNGRAWQGTFVLVVEEVA